MGSPEERLLDDAKETRKLIFTALAALAFSGIGVASLRDFELLSESGKVGLPLLNVDVPVRTFFYTMPWGLFGVFLYAYSHLQRLAESLPPRTARDDMARSDTGRIWPLSELPYPKLGSGRMLSVFTQFAVWGGWPMVSVYAAIRIVPLGDRLYASTNSPDFLRRFSAPS